MFIDLDAEFHVLKLAFEDFLPKIIREAGNCESLILRVKSLCLKYGGTHCIWIQCTVCLKSIRKHIINDLVDVLNFVL